jgi:hypothetical protein
MRGWIHWVSCPWLPATACASIATAFAPMSYMGWATVVRAGRTAPPSQMLSNPHRKVFGDPQAPVKNGVQRSDRHEVADWRWLGVTMPLG